MNIYGDNGNVLVLQKRLQWRGYKVKITKVGIGDKIPSDSHIIIGGGGQDAGQSLIAGDLKNKSTVLKSMANSGVPMLMICGMYQMFGKYFLTNASEQIDGIGVLDLYTLGGNKRIIGNILTSTEFGELIGYENHSGCTYLEGETKPLGATKPKQGNNGKDKTEGAVYNNVFGTYLHGPVLAKAPEFADFLVTKSLETAGLNNSKLLKLDDEYIYMAQKSARTRPR
jgi:CobQ-like glutamine amidotransferase family enzyme